MSIQGLSSMLYDINHISCILRFLSYIRQSINK